MGFFPDMKKELTYKSKQGNVELLVSEDYFSAYLKINENGIISEDEILELIEKTGIKGILNLTDEEAVKKRFSEPFLIARSVSDSELKIAYLFDTDHCFDTITVKSARDFNKIARVKEDVPLAEIKLDKIDKTEQYFDVFGEPVSDMDVLERFASRFLTEKVYFSREQGMIFSLVKGYPYLDETGAITVKTDFESKGDLHNVKLDFYGDLIINGSIDNCQLFVTGDLIIRGKITNCLNSWIMAQGMLEFDSAENAFIGSGESIRFSKSLRYCYTVCDGFIEGSDKSSVFGGLLKSAEGIKIASSGSTVPVKTILEIAILPYQIERLKKITVSLSKLKRKRNRAELINRAEKQKRLESLLEKAYAKLLRDKQSPSIKIEQKIYKDTWLKIYNKRKGIFKENGKAEFKSNEQGVIIKLG